jgi:hypothetical protein
MVQRCHKLGGAGPSQEQTFALPSALFANAAVAGKTFVFSSPPASGELAGVVGRPDGSQARASCAAAAAACIWPKSRPR